MLPWPVDDGKAVVKSSSTNSQHSDYKKAPGVCILWYVLTEATSPAVPASTPARELALQAWSKYNIQLHWRRGRAAHVETPGLPITPGIYTT